MSRTCGVLSTLKAIAKWYVGRFKKYYMNELKHLIKIIRFDTSKILNYLCLKIKYYEILRN